MSDQLEYKGFVSTIEYCNVDNIYHGKVIDMPRVYISYHGKDLESLNADFIDSIEFHLDPDTEEADSYISTYVETMTG